MLCLLGLAGFRDNMKMLKYHINSAKAAVMPAFTIASGALRSCVANCGTEDKSPRKMELTQMVVRDMLKDVVLINVRARRF